jgi:uncharacterized protein (TIGR03067 family)
MPKGVSALAVAVTLAVSVRAGDDVKKDLEKLQGTWIFSNITTGGESLPPDVLKTMSCVCKDDEFTVTLQENGKTETLYIFKVKLGPSQKPKTVDLVYTFGEGLKGKTELGIYKLEGNTASFCYNEPDQPRPKDFVSPDKTSLTMVFLKRK